MSKEVNVNSTRAENSNPHGCHACSN